MARNRRSERRNDVPDRWIIDHLAGPAVDFAHRATGATRATIALCMIATAAVIGLAIAWAWTQNQLGGNVVEWPAFMPILLAMQALQLGVGLAQVETDRQQVALHALQRNLRIPIERNPERRGLLVQRNLHLAVMVAAPTAVAMFEAPPELLVQAATSMGLCCASYVLSCDRAPRQKAARPRWGDPSPENVDIDRLDRGFQEQAGRTARE